MIAERIREARNDRALAAVGRAVYEGGGMKAESGRCGMQRKSELPTQHVSGRAAATSSREWWCGR